MHIGEEACFLSDFLGGLCWLAGASGWMPDPCTRDTIEASEFDIRSERDLSAQGCPYPRMADLAFQGRRLGGLQATEREALQVS